jgi:hypothetical protein
MKGKGKRKRLGIADLHKSVNKKEREREKETWGKSKRNVVSVRKLEKAKFERIAWQPRP